MAEITYWKPPVELKPKFDLGDRVSVSLKLHGLNLSHTGVIIGCNQPCPGDKLYYTIFWDDPKHMRKIGLACPIGAFKEENLALLENDKHIPLAEIMTHEHESARQWAWQVLRYGDVYDKRDPYSENHGRIKYVERD